MSTQPRTTSFHIRHFTPDTDLPRLVQLYAVAEAVDHTGEDVSEETLRGMLALPEHDPIADRWVAVAEDDADALVGFCSIWKVPTASHADITGVVHPAWRRCGIGAELLARSLQRARERQAAHIFAYASLPLQVSHSFLQRHGFYSRALYSRLRAPATITAPSVILPDGYRIAVYDERKDFLNFVYAIQHCFQGQWGHHDRITEEDVRGWFAEMHLEGIFLLFGPDDTVVGLCRAEISEQLSRQQGRRVGYIDAPGIVPEARDEALYQPLLSTAITWLQTQQAESLEMESWGDSERVLALYQQNGFANVYREAIYRSDFVS